jgi:hypothetical protein
MALEVDEMTRLSPIGLAEAEVPSRWGFPENYSIVDLVLPRVVYQFRRLGQRASSFVRKVYLTEVDLTEVDATEADLVEA